MPDLQQLVVTRDKGVIALWVTPESGQIADFYQGERYQEVDLGYVDPDALAKLQAIQRSTAPEDEAFMDIIHLALNAKFA